MNVDDNIYPRHIVTVLAHIAIAVTIQNYINNISYIFWLLVYTVIAVFIIESKFKNKMYDYIKIYILNYAIFLAAILPSTAYNLILNLLFKCKFELVILLPPVIEDYYPNFLIWIIIPNLLYLIIVFNDLVKKIPLISEYMYNNISFISNGIFTSLLFTIAIVMGNEITSTQGLPISDLPMTAYFAIGIFIILLTPLFISLSNIHIYNGLFNNKLKFSLMVIQGLNIVISIIILWQPRYITNNLRKIAYLTDFQKINSYFSAIEIKNNMNSILNNNKSTAKVRLHENGHISLMCIKKQDNTLSKIYVFKYDDLEKEFALTPPPDSADTSTKNEQPKVFQDIIDNCKVE